MLKRDRADELFDEQTIEKFLRLWIEISSDDRELTQARTVLADKLTRADEVGLMDGTEPMLRELEPFRDTVQKKARFLAPDLSRLELINFVYVVLHADEEDIERISHQIL